MTTHINPIGYAELHTNDLPRAKAFYCELLGWQIQEEETPMGPYAMFQGYLAGLTTNRDSVPTGWVSYFNVPDVVASTKRVKALGGQVLRDCVAIPEGTFSIVRDPLGSVIGLWQRK